MSRAEYMRDYRARRKAGGREVATVAVSMTQPEIVRHLRFELANLRASFDDTTAENIALTEEVARLKRLLAERSQPVLPLLTREERGIGPDSRVLPYNRDPVAAAMSEFHPAPKTRKK